MRNLLLRSLGCLLLCVVLTTTHAQTTQLALQEKGWNNNQLVAKWKNGTIIYDLKKDGASMVTVSGRECPGTWTVKGNTVTIVPKRLKWKKADPCSQPGTLYVVRVNAEDMTISDSVTEQEVHLAKIQ